MTRRVGLAAAFAAAALMAAPMAAARSAHAAPGPALGPTVSPEAVGFDAARLKRLDDYMEGAVAQGRVAGMTTLLVRHGKVVDYKVYGKANLATGAPMTKDAIVRIYSMSKPLTGVGMMILFEEGKWRLDDPVSRYVPEFAHLRVVKGFNARGEPILEDADRPPTMREIMSHTAGFGYGLADNNYVDHQFREKKVLGSNGLQEMVDRMAGIPLKFQPGTSWAYSAAVDVQGYIIQKISGEPFGQFMAEHVFRPLKMNDTGFFVPPAKASRLAAVYVYDKDQKKLVEPKDLFGGEMPTYLTPPALESGGGGMVSTTADYARFCQMILNGGVLDGVRILSPESIQLMDTNVIPKSVLVNTNGTEGIRFNEAVGFGLDFQVDRDPRAAGFLEGKNTMSWGGAAGTWFWIDPTNDLYFVGMVQRLGGTGGDDLGTQARTLTYQALVHPAK